MRKFGAMEGDIRLRLGARIKRNKAGLMLKSRTQRFTFWNVVGGRGLFIYTADEYTHAHIDSGIFFFNFSMISLGRVWFVGKKSSYVYIFLNLIKLLVLITNNQ